MNALTRRVAFLFAAALLFLAPSAWAMEFDFDDYADGTLHGNTATGDGSAVFGGEAGFLTFTMTNPSGITGTNVSGGRFGFQSN